MMRVLEPFAAQPRRAVTVPVPVVATRVAPAGQPFGVPYFPRRALLDADGRIVWSD